MNLRTHTYTIPALAGLAAFALLVSADYSIRRMMNGSGYGFAAYVTDVNDIPRVGRALLEAALDPEPMARALVEFAPAGPAEADVEATAGMAPAPVPEAAGTEAAMILADEAPLVEDVPHDLPLAVIEPLPEPIAPAVADVPLVPASAVPEALPETGPAGFRANCSEQGGFKRCRVGQ